MYFLEAALLQEQRHLLAAPAVMADRDHFGLRIELAHARRDLAHRHEVRALDARLLVFPGLAHVQQHGLAAPGVGQPGRELGRCDLLHQNLKREGCSQLASAAITVSNRSTLRAVCWRVCGPQATYTRALIAGASPTMANRRPPVSSCSRKARGSTGVEPVSTMTW